MDNFKHELSFYEWMAFIKHNQYCSEIVNWIANKEI